MNVCKVVCMIAGILRPVLVACYPTGMESVVERSAATSSFSQKREDKLASCPCLGIYRHLIAHPSACFKEIATVSMLAVQRLIVSIPVVECRCRLQMLLAALNLLHKTLKTQEGGGRRRQAAESAVTKLIEKFDSSLLDQGAGAQTGNVASSQQGNWQQVRHLHPSELLSRKSCTYVPLCCSDFNHHRPLIMSGTNSGPHDVCRGKRHAL